MNLAPIFNDAPYVDSNGNPFVGANLYTYVAGSSTPAVTYTSATGLVQNANPMPLNSGGYPTTSGSQTQIWLTAGVSYKFALETSGGTPIWTRDNISGINDTTSSQDQWVSGPAPTFVSATSFSLVGDQTSTFHIGRRLKTTNSGGTIYSTIIASAFGASTTITVANDSGVLDSGLSAVSYGLISAANTSDPAIGDTYVCEGRLTLTSGTAVTTADVTAAETVYFTPFRGNRVDIYDATALRWVRYKLTELSVDVPDATQMNDVFVYNNAGTLTLDVTAWTNDTTRATALVLQDGVLVKSGATGRRYLGSFYATNAGNGQTEDSILNRYLWNYYNRVKRTLRVIEGTDTWAYSVAVFQQTNASTANQLNFAIGVSEDSVGAVANSAVSSSGATVRACRNAVGLDSTTVKATGSITGVANVDSTALVGCTASWEGYPGIGKHFIAWLELGGGADTQTWTGDAGGTATQTGIHGWVLG